MKLNWKSMMCLAVIFSLEGSPVPAQTPLGREVTYQGRLNMGGAPLNATADFEFSLWDDPAAGLQIGATQAVNNVTVVDGLFTAELDFGANAFGGDARWLQIAVASPSGGGLTTLSPRQPVTATPFALQTRGIVVANNGNVAIGTDTLAERLTVADNTDATLRIENLGDGSAAVQFAATDQEYEWRMKANNKMGFFDNTAGGLERLTVDTAGNFGVGVTAPDTPFSLMGNGGTFPVGITQNAVGGSATMELTTTDSLGKQASRIVMRGGSGGDTADIEFYTGAQGAETQTMIIDGATGNVGIGTSNPASKLDVAGTVTATAFVGDGSGLTGVGGADGHSLDAADGSPVDAVFVDADGKVGIGTTNPESPLTIRNGSALPVGITQGQLRVHDMELTSRDGSGGQATRVSIGGYTNDPTVRFYSGARGAEFEYAYFDNTSSGGIMELTDASGQDQIRLGCSSDGGELIVRDTTGLLVAKVESTSNGGQIFVRDTSGTKQAEMYVDSNGDGRVVTDVMQINGGADIAEPFNINVDHDTVHDDVVPGMVVSIDPTNVGELRLSTSAYDRTVAGIISGAGGVKPGMTLQQPGTLADGKHPVALTGRVWCYVDATHGAVNPGDLLTTSDTPGHAMKVGDHAMAQGAIIGKAMTSLESGKGLVMVLVTLQ